MKRVEGWWLPDHEEHLVAFLETTKGGPVGTYQAHKLSAALKYVRGWRRAVDVGAHVGLWSRPLWGFFQDVVAFEPVAGHRDCWQANIAPPNRVPPRTVLPWALHEREGAAAIHVSTGSSGDAWLRSEEAGDGERAELRVYDSLPAIRDLPVDFVKLDCEGGELFALRGMERMLRRDRPAVIVEQKPGRAARYGLGETEAVTWLEGLGATLREEIGGDYILSWW